MKTGLTKKQRNRLELYSRIFGKRGLQMAISMLCHVSDKIEQEENFNRQWLRQVDEQDQQIERLKAEVKRLRKRLEGR